MKNILLAISGLTPQIVTETLFALSIQKKISIDEIFVITTKRGKTVIEGKDKNPTTPKTSLKKEITNLCREFDIKLPKFTIQRNVIVAEEESLELYDIRTDKENKLFPNKTAEVIKTLTDKSNTTIHASLSGGRKSMSAHLALILSLFARYQDKLYHIITDEKFEFKNFYPKSKAEIQALTIAEIPFVRLRALKNNSLGKMDSYIDIVEEAQKNLHFLTDDAKLVINLANKTIFYKGEVIKLETTELALYYKFIEQKLSTDSGLSIIELQSKEFAKDVKNFLTEKFNAYYDPEADKNHWTNIGFKAERIRTIRSKINNKLKHLFTEHETYAQFKIESQKKWGDTIYYIPAPKNKIGINYE